MGPLLQFCDRRGVQGAVDGAGHGVCASGGVEAQQEVRLVAGGVGLLVGGHDFPAHGAVVIDGGDGVLEFDLGGLRLIADLIRGAEGGDLAEVDRHDAVLDGVAELVQERPLDDLHVVIGRGDPLHGRTLAQGLGMGAECKSAGEAKGKGDDDLFHDGCV